MKIITPNIEKYQRFATLVKEWISTYYPSGVIDGNISTVIAILHPVYLPSEIIVILRKWILFVKILINEENKKLINIQNDQFWVRLSTTLLVLYLVSKKDKKTPK